MSCLRLFVFMFTLLSGGVAHASIASFDGASRVSDEVLDRMRGGFVVSFNGMDFLLPFSITGIERLTQIGNQTFINGQLVSPSVNPQALTAISQTNQLGVNVQSLTPAPLTPAAQASVAQTPVTPAPVTQEPVARVPATPLPVTQDPAVLTSVTRTPSILLPVTQTPATQTPATQAAAGQAAAGQTSVVQTPETPPSVTQTPVTVATGATGSAGAQVITNGSLIVIQSGGANTVVLPPNVALDSLATYIQNTVNAQVIRNITTLNITIEAQKLATQTRLNALQSRLNDLRF